MCALSLPFILDTTLFSHREAFNASSFLPDGQHLLSLHPRRYLNIYHVLSGLSLLLRVAIHPEAYPNVLSSLRADA